MHPCPGFPISPLMLCDPEGRTPQLDRGTHRTVYWSRLPKGSEGWNYPVHVSAGVGKCFSSGLSCTMWSCSTCHLKPACFSLNESCVFLFFFLCYCFVEDLLTGSILVLCPSFHGRAFKVFGGLSSAASYSTFQTFQGLHVTNVNGNSQIHSQKSGVLDYILNTRYCHSLASLLCG